MMQTVTSEQLYVLSLACSMVSPDIKGVWPHGAMPTAYIFVPKLLTDNWARILIRYVLQKYLLSILRVMHCFITHYKYSRIINLYAMMKYDEV